jgi:hypothetical protein
MTDTAAATTAPTTTEAASAPAVETTATSTPEAAAPAGPSAAEVQRAKYDALLARNAERRANLAKREAQIAERESKAPKAEAYRENPLKMFEDMGLPPVEALDRLVEHTTLEGTPEGALRREMAELRREAQEAKRLAKELHDAREREREEQQAKAAQETTRKAEAAMVEHLESPAYEGLTKFYTPEQLLAASHSVAEQLHAAGKRVTYEAIGQVILSSHRDSIARYRSATDPSPAASVSAPSSSDKPKTLTPDLATQSATKASRRETWEERVQRLAQRESRR